MAKDNKNPKKTTKSTKKAPVKSTNNSNKKNGAKKVNTVKQTVKVSETKKVETKIVEPEKTEIVNTGVKKSTKKVEKVNFVSKVKDFIKKNWEEKREFSIACIIIALLICIIILLAVSKQVPKLKNGKEVIASVDGMKVTSDDLYLSMKESYGTTELMNKIDEFIAEDYAPKETEEDKKYVEEVVDYYKKYAEYYGTSFEEFLRQYVGISGVSDEDEFRSFVKKDYKKTLAIQKYIGNTISEEDLKKAFEESYKEKLTVRHILIEVNDEVTEEDAKAKAQDLIAKLDEVKDDAEKLEEKFKDLAFENSDDKGTYEDGGLFKDFSKNGVDENFYNASKDLEDGKYTKEAVKSQYGYHVILKISSKTNKYKDVKNDIKTDLAKEKLSTDSTLSVTAWDELRKEYGLKINDSDVKSEYNKNIKKATDKEENSSNEKTEDSSSEE